MSDFELYSDLHKDALGSRPSGDKMEWFEALPYAEKEAEWNYLCQVLEESERERIESEQRAIEEFEASIIRTIEMGAGDRATALRWMFSEELKGGWHEIEYTLWDLGLPLGSRAQTLICEIMGVPA